MPVNIPRTRASFFETIPSGIGLNFVLSIVLSMSSSNHILIAAEEPAPSAIAIITRILFKKSREGLLLLQKSYSNVSESICHSLQYYIDMINKKLSLTKGENLLIDNDNTQDDASSNGRSISSELKSFWNENMIIIICKLIDELDKTKDEQDRDSIINSIESILDSKDRHLKTIVEKYSSTIV